MAGHITAVRLTHAHLLPRRGMAGGYCHESAMGEMRACQLSCSTRLQKRPGGQKGSVLQSDVRLIADMNELCRHVAFVPKPDACTAANDHPGAAMMLSPDSTFGTGSL